ncbi:MAG: hydroxymethylbilane synthase [Planctomycetales bacterium]|nr:hydroxymethylbilane synthase [Planctomycetales bacterium]
MSLERPIRLGTRGSMLARRQADWTAQRLRDAGHSVEIIEITTKGDVVTGSLAAAGGIGLFTRAIQQALLDQEIDLAVHSLKDLPTDPVSGLRLGGVPEREVVSDVLIGREPISLSDLPAGAVVGTGSLRRRAQLWHARRDLDIRDIRGNLDTRLRKLDEGQYDAIILASAGLKRLGWDHVHATELPHDIMLPAVGQGALGWEIRSGDDDLAAALAEIEHRESHLAVLAERSLLRELRGGCLAPVGAHAVVDEHSLRLDAVVLDPQGTERRFATIQLSGSELTPQVAEEAGRTVANQLLADGAEALIQASRPIPEPPEPRESDET